MGTKELQQKAIISLSNHFTVSFLVCHTYSQVVASDPVVEIRTIVCSSSNVAGLQRILTSLVPWTGRRSLSMCKSIFWGETFSVWGLVIWVGRGLPSSLHYKLWRSWQKVFCFSLQEVAPEAAGYQILGNLLDCIEFLQWNQSTAWLLPQFHYSYLFSFSQFWGKRNIHIVTCRE